MTTQKRGNFQDEKNYRKGRRSREKVCNLCNAINLEPRHVTACLGLDNRSSKFATKSNFNRFSFLLILNNLNINGINAKSTEDRIKACCCPYWWPIILILSQSFMSKKRTDILKSETWRSSICLHFCEPRVTQKYIEVCPRNNISEKYCCGCSEQTFAITTDNCKPQISDLTKLPFKSKLILLRCGILNATNCSCKHLKTIRNDYPGMFRGGSICVFVCWTIIFSTFTYLYFGK